MGVATSEIEADEVVTLPTMISCKHLQGGPRPPNVPLQELTQELSWNQTSYAMGSSHPFMQGERTPNGCGTLPYHSMFKVCGTLPYCTKFYIRNYWYCLSVYLFQCWTFFPHAVDALFFIFVVDMLSIKN